MATIKLEAGDRFSCKKNGKNGYGVVLPDSSAFILFGEEGRPGYEAHKGEIPCDPSVAPLKGVLPHEVTFALDCVSLSHGLQPTVARF